jgi:hypothetical protein
MKKKIQQAYGEGAPFQQQSAQVEGSFHPQSTQKNALRRLEMTRSWQSQWVILEDSRTRSGAGQC